MQIMLPSVVTSSPHSDAQSASPSLKQNSSESSEYLDWLSMVFLNKPILEEANIPSRMPSYFQLNIYTLLP